MLFEWPYSNSGYKWPTILKGSHVTSSLVLVKFRDTESLAFPYRLLAERFLMIINAARILMNLGDSYLRLFTSICLPDSGHTMFSLEFLTTFDLLVKNPCEEIIV